MDETKCKALDEPVTGPQGQLTRFATGAVRGTDADGERWDLITPIGLRRLAQTCAEGARKYGEHNWTRGIPASVMLNHAIRHIYLYLQGDKSEDHYTNAAFYIDGGVAVVPTFAFLFPVPKQAEALASIMAHQHLGSAFFSHDSLHLYCGESRILSLLDDGEVRLGRMDIGRRLGAR